MTIDTNMLKYNALDSAITLACQTEIWDEMKRAGYEATYKLTADAFPALLYISCRGINVDKDALEIAKVETRGLIVQKQAQLDEAVGHPLNVGSSKQCQAYFYAELGNVPYTKTSRDANGRRKQSITTDDKAMARLARGTASRKPIPAARIVQELRGLNKLSGTYLEIEFDADGRLRCSVNPRGTRFGRISTSQTIFGTGTNMQNLPETFKRFLIADPGCVLYEMDKAKAEWVVVAYRSGDAGMIEVCESGLDPHTHTAYRMYGVDKKIIDLEAEQMGHLTDPEEIKQKRSYYEHQGIDTSRWPKAMTMRQAGKKSNHGLNYDEGYATFALMNAMQESEAKRIIAMYHEGYPGIRRWHENVQTMLRHDRTLYNTFGRKYKFLDSWGNDLFKAAYAFEPQSTVADLLNSSLALTYNDPRPFMHNTEILTQVHDSALNQFHLARSKYNYREYAQCVLAQQVHMNPTLKASGREYHIDTDMKVGDRWGTLKDVPIGDNVNELEDRLEAVCKELDV